MIHLLKGLGELHKCLGRTITRDCTKRTLHISQENFARNLVDEYLSSRDYTCPTALPREESLTKVKSNEFRANVTQLQKAIGSLMYLQRGSRPDIIFVVCRLAQYCTDPKIRHWNALVKVYRYLKGTLC